MNLWEYLDYRGSVTALKHSAERMGAVLAALHGTHVELDREARDPFVDLHTRVAEAHRCLQTLRGGSGCFDYLLDAIRRLQERQASNRLQSLSLIHGGLGWDCIHYGTDGRFYLYRFETCRHSDAGFDLGGFVADLLCFALNHHDEETYRFCLETFLHSYNEKAVLPTSEDHLRPYIALALCERRKRLGFAERVGPERLRRFLEFL